VLRCPSLDGVQRVGGWAGVSAGLLCVCVGGGEVSMMQPQRWWMWDMQPLSEF
jgi:hypothetical protein